MHAPDFNTAPFTGGDYRLHATSPAINMGDNSFFPDLDENTEDLAGNPRLVGDRIDMGAYENPNGALPVTLLSFKAQKQGNTVHLTWQTTEEVNASHYEIERSGNGKSWEKIGTVTAVGNSQAVLNYHFSDIAPADGISYYRLKMTDLDGSFSYSIIRSISIRDAAESMIRAYPNPVSSSFRIQGVSGKAVQAVQTIELMSVAGYPLRKWTRPQPSAPIPVDGLPDGMYIVKLTLQSGAVQRVKIVVAR